MLGEGLFCVSARVRKSMETGFIIFRITEPRFDALRFKDRGDLPAAGIDYRVIALVPAIRVVMRLRTIIEQVNMVRRIALDFLNPVHRIQRGLDRFDMLREHTF